MQWNTEQHLPGKSLWSNTEQKKEPGAFPPLHCSKVLVLCWLWNSSPPAEVAFAEVSLMEPYIPPTYFSSGKGCRSGIQGNPGAHRGKWDILTLHFHVMDWNFNKSVGKIKRCIFPSWPKIQLTSVSPSAELLDKFCGIPHLYPWLGGESKCKESEKT